MSVDEWHAAHVTDMHQGAVISPHTQKGIFILLAIVGVVFAIVFRQIMAREKEEEERRKDR